MEYSNMDKSQRHCHDWKKVRNIYRMVIMKIKNIPTVSLETHKDADVFEDIFQTYIRMGTYQEKGMEIAIKKIIE